ncbi:MAG: AI-2E family transporter [Candidatus Delongbacteria bacterium]
MLNPGTRRRGAPIVDDRRLSGSVQTPVLIAATILGLWICWQLTLPFLSVLVWALTLAVLFAPLQLWLEARLGRPGLAAALCVLVVALLVALPVVFVGQRLIQESILGAELVRGKVESGEWLRALEARPRLAPVAQWVRQSIDLPGTIQAFVGWMSAAAGSVLRGSAIQLAAVGLTFYLFYYLLRDRVAALQVLRSASPLSRVDMDRLLERLGDTISATVYGTLAVALIQGLLGGLMFWWLGLPAPLFWGVVMALLSVIPVLGAFIIWVPAALFLLLAGQWGRALILALWGGIVVGGVDNLLRPMLVGRRLHQHTLVAFISVVGGLLLFGASGLILGPLTFTLTAVLLESWRKPPEDPPRLSPDGPWPPKSDR